MEFKLVNVVLNVSSATIKLVTHEIITESVEDETSLVLSVNAADTQQKVVSNMTKKRLFLRKKKIHMSN